MFTVKFINLIFGFLIIVLSTGCAAYVSRYDLVTNQRSGDPVTPYFSGSATDLRGIHSGITAPFRSGSGERKSIKSRTSEFLGTIFYLVDLPLSIVLDILIIPSDREFIKRNSSKGKLLDSLMDSAEDGN